MSPSPISHHQVLSLALPVALQVFMQSTLGMADVIMVAPLGAEALAAVGLAAKLHFLLLVLMSGIATGCSVLVAQYLGAKDLANSQRTLGSALALGLWVVCPFVLLCGFFSYSWSPWLTPDAQVAQLCAQFMQITALALLFTQFTVIYEASLRAQGHTWVPLAAAGLSILCNVLLNYLLIYGHWGAPALGVAGAAWGTLIARALQLGVLLAWLYGRGNPFALGLAALRQGFNATGLWPFLRFSAPVMANYAIWGIGNCTYHALTGFAGTQALAAMAVLVPLESGFIALFVGLASACAVLVGHALGANDTHTALALRRYFERLTLGLLLLLCSALWLAQGPILRALHPEAGLDTLLSGALALFCLLSWVKVLNMLRIIGLLRPGGDTGFCLATDTLVMWGLGIPLFAACIFIWPLSFLWLYALLFVEDALKFIPVWRRLRQGHWLNNLTRTTSSP